MNSLRGTITHIDYHDNLSFFGIDIGGSELFAVVIENPGTASWLRKGSSVVALFKETQVILLRDTDDQQAMLNTLRGEITEIEESPIFSRITLKVGESTLNAVTPTRFGKSLNLEPGGHIIVHLQPNEIMIAPC